MSGPSRARRGLPPLRKTPPLGADKLREILVPFPRLLELLLKEQARGEGSVFSFGHIARMKRGDATKYLRAAVLWNAASADNYWVLVKRTGTVERKIKTNHGVGLLEAFEKDMLQAIRSSWSSVISKSRGDTDYSDIVPYW